MTGQEAPTPQWLTDPKAVIVELVMAIEPQLDPARILATVERVCPHQPRQRALTRVLAADPDLLTSGRPQGPRHISG